MSLVARGYQDPAYVSRLSFNGGIAAGANTQSGKWIAFANAQLMSLNGVLTTLSTSTYNGTASAIQASVVTVINTSTTSTVALSTTTIGPFTFGGQGTAGQVGGYNQYAINTSTGTTGFGGVPLPQGSYVFVVTGTDATGAISFIIDIQLAPQAPLTV